MDLLQVNGGLVTFSFVRRIYASVALLILVWPLTASLANSERRKVVCKTPENEKKCYWTHGRLGTYNGYPAYRLWKIGTDRVLGIYSGHGAEELDALDNEHPKLPSILDNYDLAKGRVFGDFEVCPLEPEQEGYMQRACIESAKNVVREKLK